MTWQSLETYIICPGKRAVRSSVVEARPGKWRPAVGLLISLGYFPNLSVLIQFSDGIQLTNFGCDVTIIILIIITGWRMPQVEAVKDFWLLCWSLVRFDQLRRSRLSLEQSPSLLVGTVQTFGRLGNLKFNNVHLPIIVQIHKSYN